MITMGKLFLVLAGALVLGPALCWAGEPAPAGDWSGVYLGVNVGWDGAAPRSITTTDYDANKYLNVPSDQEDVGSLGNQQLTSDNFTGGGQVGCNWQAGDWVVGVETDFNVFNTHESVTRAKKYVSAPTATLTLSSTVTTDWLWTLRPRVGYVIADRWLIYGTGGLTVTELEADFTLADDYAAVLSNAYEHQNISKTRTGWAAGGGVEVALDRNWSVRSEYLYADLGTVKGEATDLFTTGGYQSNTFQRSMEFTTQIARVSLNYKF